MLFRSRELLDRIASVLLEREVLDGKEFEALMNGEELPPKPERRNGNGGGTAPKSEESGGENASEPAMEGAEEIGSVFANKY